MRPYKMPDYLVAGEGEATVYLLHSGYGSKEYWRYTTQILNEAGVIFPEFKGVHG